ncbi:hypothetical protein JNM05_05060 [bacterium]|nr:hypothetical protein [bacterium]
MKKKNSKKKMKTVKKTTKKPRNASKKRRITSKRQKKAQKSGKTRKKTAKKTFKPVKKKTATSKKKTAKISSAKKKNSKSYRTKPIDKKKKESVSAKKKFNNSPQENLTRPFNIIESYMGDYSFTDIYSVLFVCTGNMCRSPIAEGLLKKKINEEAPVELKDKIYVHSSGIYAYEGNRPSENSVKVAMQNLIDISQIRSKPINRVQIEQSDLIFALSIDHLNFILENFPTARHKSTLLKTYGKERSITIADSIPDPIGFSMEFYIKTFTEIKNAVDAAFPMILAAAQQKIFQKKNDSNL